MTNIVRNGARNRNGRPGLRAKAAAEASPPRRPQVTMIARGLEPPYPRLDLPHVAVCGRSNVGKSSMFNRLVGKKVAGVGGTPGRTRSLSFYSVDDAFVMCDLPGYGYAKVAETLRQRWKRAIEHYLTRGPRVAVAITLVDARHPPQPLDVELGDYLHALGIPRLVVLTKIDKVPRGQRRATCTAAAHALGVDPSAIVAFSALSGEGVSALWTALDTALRPAT